MKYISLFLINILLGCSSGKKQETTSQSGIPIINLSENVLTVSSLPLSEAIEKFEVVPLETRDESLIREINMLKTTDQHIWIENFGEESVYRFSRSGKFLNKIGNVGQGPGEYSTFRAFLIDENKKEVYILSNNNGVLVYNFEGGFERKLTEFQSLQNLTASVITQYILHDDKFFATQNTPLYRPVEEDSLWSFASLGYTFQERTFFKNPAHIGREEQIIANCANMDRFVNYWVETPTKFDTYNKQLTLKYPDTDTIYYYDPAKNDLFPEYAIYTQEKKGDYEQTHLWFPSRKAFDYFSIASYYPAKDLIYLIGTKGDEIYTYAYNKQDGSVRLQKRQGKITERKVPWFDIPLLQMKRPFVLDNDICGGEFTVDNRSAGKYWTQILHYENVDELLINKIKSSTVKDEAKKNELLQVLENMDEDSNPVLLIATLK